MFLYSTAALTDCASSPTRRSSDLERHAVAPRVVRAVRERREVELRANQIAKRRVVRIPSVRLHVIERWVSARRGASDRKSTRLNSSHPSISYAVFCLKKKTSR